MKKIIKIMVVTTLVGISMATYAFAGYGNDFFKNNVNYVDTNGDGVCDNYGTMENGANYVDANSDGVCDNYGTMGNGVNYVDANGDGICDNYGTMRNGVNYVDANGDGICDNYGNKVCPKNGMGRKWGLMNK